MSRIRKTKSLQNLAKFDVLIEDRTANSDYFRVSQLPSILTGGKNSFLVGGSPFLRPNSRILVEIVNSSGDTIFNEPVSSETEGSSRIITIEIYENTVPGAYKVILLGEADSYIGGTSIPEQWVGVYNVRWISDIIVEPSLRNSSPIRLQTQPKLFVEELSYSLPSSSFENITLPFSASLQPLLESSILKGYTVRALDGLTFTGKMLTPVLSGSAIIKNIFTSVAETCSIELPITKIINETTAISTGHYVKIGGQWIEEIILYSGSYTSTNYEVTASSLNLEYKTFSVEADPGIDTGSFAKLRLVDIQTYSGEILKTQISYKIAGDVGEYIVAAKPDITVNELLVTQSNIGEVRIGYFDSTNPTVITDNWYTSLLITGSNPVYPIEPSIYYLTSSYDVDSCLPLQFTSDKLLDSLNAQVPIYNGSYSASAAHFIGTIEYFRLFESSEYTLKFDAFHSLFSGSTTLNPTLNELNVYLVPNSESRIISDDPLGQKITTLRSSNYGQQLFENTEINFIPAVVGQSDVALRFVANGGFWKISNVSLKPSIEYSFNPDETTLIVPITNFGENSLIFKSEFFDINNNSTNIYVTSDPTYFIGGGGGGSSVSASYSQTASLAYGIIVESGPSDVAVPSYTGSFTGSFTGSYTGSLSGSLIGTAATASYMSGTLDFPAGLTITGSLYVSGGYTLLTGDVLPQISSSYDIGSITTPWRRIYNVTDNKKITRQAGGTSLTPNMDTSSVYVWTNASEANIAFNTPTNAEDGDILTTIVINNNISSVTVTFPSSFYGPTGVPGVSYNVGALARISQTWVYDDSTSQWIQITGLG